MRSHVRSENRDCRERIHSSFTQYSFDVLVATLIVNSELVMSCHVHNVDERIFECNCKSINCFVVRLTQATCAEIRNASCRGRIDPCLCRIPVTDARSHIEFDTVFIITETKKY